MSKTNYGRRLFLVLLVVGWALYNIGPTLVYFSMPKETRNDEEVFQKTLPSWLPKQRINLGLDLQGGVQLALGVNTNEAVDNKIDRIGTEVTRWAQDQKIPVETAYAVKGQQRLRVQLKPGTIDPGEFSKKFKKEFQELEFISASGNNLDFGYPEAEIRQIRLSALTTAEDVVRNRVDKWGVAEPMINRRADNAILVQLPGFKDPEKAKKLLGETAQLKFKIVDDDFRGFDDLVGKLPEGVTSSYKNSQSGGKTVELVSESKQAILDIVQGKIPEDRELLFQVEPIAGGKKNKYTTFVLQAANMLTGDDVANAFASLDTQGIDQRPVVALQFTSQGGKRFGEVTGANIGKRMAIVLDDQVKSDPVIQAKISGGRAQITVGGGYAQQVEEVNQLVLVLKSGAIPAKITILEERQVGASLGPELANQGILASVCGLAFVFLFMFAYYRRPGIIACIALAFNGIFLIALMSILGFSLTLPGIAGFILTLGMAVDANVLINERIRQELREGRAAKNAIENGFQKVFWTIFDSNVTTLIAAIVLLETSTSGPIRGFAVTLIVGLLVSMFTALYCSKLMFHLFVRNIQSDRDLRIWLGGEKILADHKVFNFDFLKHGPLVTAVSTIIMFCTITFIGVKGLNWSVDFAGGNEMTVVFENDVESNDLRKVVEETGAENLTIQALGGGKKEYLLRFDAEASVVKQALSQDAQTSTKAESEKAKSIQSAIFSAFESQRPVAGKFKSDFVGPQVGKELRNQGIMSLFYAIIGVLIYIAFRFDSRFAPGAVIKMVLDMFVVIAYYAMFWRSFDLTSVAALLTVIGYSVNDAIVIFDRVRENIVLHPRRNIRENVNVAVNETLARSINTSLVTLLSLIGLITFSTSQIWDFSVAMAVGVVSATISSTFIATNAVVVYDEFRKRKSKGAAKVLATSNI